MKKNIVIVASIAIVAIFACKHKPEEIIAPNINTTSTTGSTTNGSTTGATTGTVLVSMCNPDTVYFNEDIKPLLISNCTMSGCHNDVDHADGMSFMTYNQLMSEGIVSTNNPTNSDLYDAITETDPDKVMPRPPMAPLSAAQIQMILTWMQQGAQNNSCPKVAVAGCDTTKWSYLNDVKPVIDSKCKGCHSGSAPSAGILLDTYTNTKTQALNGFLYGTINHSAGYKPMPYNANKLGQCEIELIQRWINKGAPNN